MAALTTGVAWLGAGPAAADTCLGAQVSMGSPAAALCDELDRVHLSDRTRPLVGSESTHLALGAYRLAERMNLTGLVTTHWGTGRSDLGGFMANSDMPALSPVQPQLRNATALVKLSSLPATPAVADRPRSPRTGGYPTGAGPRSGAADVGLTRPVNQVKDQVVRRTLPKSSQLADRNSIPARSYDGVTGLLLSLKLR